MTSWLYSYWYPEEEIKPLQPDDPVRLEALDLPSVNVISPAVQLVNDIGNFQITNEDIIYLNNFLQGERYKSWIKQSYETNFIINKFGYGFEEDLKKYKELYSIDDKGNKIANPDKNIYVVGEINILEEDGYYIDIFTMTKDDVAYERHIKLFDEEAINKFQLAGKVKLTYRLNITHNAKDVNKSSCFKLSRFALQRLVLQISKLHCNSDIQHMKINEKLHI